MQRTLNTRGSTSCGLPRSTSRREPRARKLRAAGGGQRALLTGRACLLHSCSLLFSRPLSRQQPYSLNSTPVTSGALQMRATLPQVVPHPQPPSPPGIQVSEALQQELHAVHANPAHTAGQRRCSWWDAVADGWGAIAHAGASPCLGWPLRPSSPAHPCMPSSPSLPSRPCFACPAHLSGLRNQGSRMKMGHKWSASLAAASRAGLSCRRSPCRQGGSGWGRGPTDWAGGSGGGSTGLAASRCFCQYECPSSYPCLAEPDDCRFAHGGAAAAAVARLRRYGAETSGGDACGGGVRRAG